MNVIEESLLRFGGAFFVSIILGCVRFIFANACSIIDLQKQMHFCLASKY